MNVLVLVSGPQKGEKEKNEEGTQMRNWPFTYIVNHFIPKKRRLQQWGEVTQWQLPASLYFCDQKQQSENRSLIFEGQDPFCPPWLLHVGSLNVPLHSGWSECKSFPALRNSQIFRSIHNSPVAILWRDLMKSCPASEQLSLVKASRDPCEEFRSPSLDTSHLTCLRIILVECLLCSPCCSEGLIWASSGKHNYPLK